MATSRTSNSAIAERTPYLIGGGVCRYAWRCYERRSLRSSARVLMRGGEVRKRHLAVAMLVAPVRQHGGVGRVAYGSAATAAAHGFAARQRSTPNRFIDTCAARRRRDGSVPRPDVIDTFFRHFTRTDRWHCDRRGELPGGRRFRGAAGRSNAARRRHSSPATVESWRAAPG